MVLFDPNSTEYELYCCLCGQICGLEAYWNWANKNCFLRKRNDAWLVDRHDLTFEDNFESYEDAPFPMHTPCWDILEASWDYMESRPFDFTAMADIFIAQPRYQAGTLPPHYSVMACWFLFAGYASRFFERDKHQAPDDFSYVSSICEQEHRRCRTLSPASRCMAISKRQMRNTRPFSTLVAIDQLPLELCLRILCYLPTVSVKAARLASRAMADVPLAGTYWKSRFSRPDLAHIPLSSLLQPSKTHAEGVVDLKPVLSRCTGQNISREQIIIYAKALIEIVKQRRKVLELPTYPCLPEDIVCHRFLSVPRDSHKDWQISDKLKEWRSSVIFDRERPISSCYEIKLTFIPSHRDRYLSGIEFHFPQYILTLGYTEADTKLAIEHGKFQRTGVLGISSSDYGFLEVWAADEVDDIVSETEGFDEADNGCDKSWKSALFPAKSSQIYGFQAELSVDNRITSLGLLEPKSAQRTTADRIVDEFYQKEYGKEGLNWSN